VGGATGDRGVRSGCGGGESAEGPDERRRSRPVTTDALPGLALEVVRTPPDPDVLRTDVAAILGRTRRGPVGVALRVDSWTEFQRWYGPADGGAATPDAVRGFFDNGGGPPRGGRGGRPPPAAPPPRAAPPPP